MFIFFRRCRWHRWQTFIREYLREFSKKFEMIMMRYSEARGTLIYEKNLKPKISCQTPFKYFLFAAPFQTKCTLYTSHLVNISVRHSRCPATLSLACTHYEGHHHLYWRERGWAWSHISRHEENMEFYNYLLWKNPHQYIGATMFVAQIYWCYLCWQCQ